MLLTFKTFEGRVSISARNIVAVQDRGGQTLIHVIGSARWFSVDGETFEAVVKRVATALDTMPDKG